MMEDVAKTVREEIRKTEQKLAKLRRIESILGEDTTVLMKGNMPKIRRVLKYRKFSDIETRQIIDLYNKLPLDLPSKASKIASVMKMPKDKIYNKLYLLAKERKIQPINAWKFKPKRKLMEQPKRVVAPSMYWTNEMTAQLIRLVSEHKRPMEISQIMGIDRKTINNKTNRLKRKGIIPYEKALKIQF